MRAIFPLGCKVLVLLGLVLGAFTFPANAQTTQTFGNEWINYSQQYYKIKIARTGIYRLTAADLAAAGISNVNSEKFQLIRRGQEVAIHVSGQPGQPLGTNDYIEFFGERNDGKLDTKHYKDPSFQIHTHYSLYTDTAAYFLTWGTANGKRMQVKTSNPAGLTPEPRVYREALRLKLHQYIAGTGQQTQSKTSWGDRSEGFASTAFGARTDTVSGLNLLETSGRKPQLEILVVDSYFPAAHVAFHIMPPNGSIRVLTNSQTGPTGVLSFPAFHYR
ncbi:MAG TPA: hypothetical protein VK927_00260, partial [Adhaeribacter sp.]|nr:hypothetical protein [Adhaeribacter sp.]